MYLVIVIYEGHCPQKYEDMVPSPQEELHPIRKTHSNGDMYCKGSIFNGTGWERFKSQGNPYSSQRHFYEMQIMSYFFSS